MSGHGVPRADAMSAPERKVEPAPLRLQTTKVHQQPRSEILSSGLPRGEHQFKAAIQEINLKSALPGRPIAPAPASATSATPKVLSLTAQHGVVSKYPGQVMGSAGGSLEGTPLPAATSLPAHLHPGASQSGVMTLTSQAVVNAPVITQPAQVAGVPTIQALPVTGGVTTGGGILTAQPVPPININMASLIGRPIPPSPTVTGLTSQASVAPAATQAATAVTQASVVHAFPAHVPRGAAAASALTAPKGSAVATAVLRPNQPGAPATVQIPSSAPAVIRTQLMAAGGRSGSPALQGTNLPASSPPEPARRVVNVVTSAPASMTSTLSMASAVGPSSRDPVQITIHQPRTVVDVAARPLVSPLSTRAVSPAVLQQQGVPQVGHATQKVVISTTQSGITSHLQPIANTAAVVTGPSPKPTASQSPVLNLSQHVVRPQKLPAANPGQVASPAQAASALGHGGVTGGSRPQKFLVSHPPTAPSHHQAAVTTTAKLGATTALNLSQGLRGQKVVMPASTALSAAAIPANVAKTAKVTARQLQQPVDHFSRQHEGVTPLPTRPPAASPASGANLPSTQHSGPSYPGQSTTVVGRPVSTTSPAAFASSSAAQDTGRMPTTTDSSRVGFQAPQQFAAFQSPSDYSFYNPPEIYQNFVYQHLAQHALTSGSTIRASGLLSNQTPSLAATLQASGQSTAAPTTTTSPSASSQASPASAPGTLASAPALQGAVAGTSAVRVNPMNLVTVDPSRHPSFIPSQFAASTPEGARLLQETSPSGLISTHGSLQQPPVMALSSHVAMTTPPSSSSVAQPISSPARPSILRKRPNEGGMTMVKKNLLGGAFQPVPSLRDTSSPAGEAGASLQPSSPKTAMLDPTRENSQSSTDTASSAESTPVPSHLKQKEESMDGVESVGSATAPMVNNMEASPRKKPRKQLLHATEEFIDDEDTSSDNEESDSARMNMQEKVAEEIKKEDLEEYVDEDGVRWVRDKKRPAVLNLLNSYQCNWKTRFNHFQRYTDVKPKDERRPTVNELSNQKGVQQKASGWKMFHLAAQLEDMVDMEREVCSRLQEVREELSPRFQSAQYPSMEDDLSMVHELTQGNMQRCQLLVDQLTEARECMIKVLDHRPKIKDIISRHHSKRPVKKKERT